jgi:amino acid transporter
LTSADEETAAAEQSARDVADLARLGYAQQLLRDIGGFGSFALSFSVISILTGAVTLYSHGLKHGGPLVMSAGWWLVAIMTLTVAASLAELASALPTAGALYHWARTLGGEAAGYYTAWFNIIGQFAITAAIDYGLAEFLAPMIGLDVKQRWPVVGLCAGLLFVHALCNHVGVRVVNVCNWLSAWYHVAGVALVIGCLAALAPLSPASFLATTSSPAGMGLGYAFVLGLLQAQWTFTGYDASAHVSEETRDPRRVAPWGIFLSVAVSALAGAALLSVVTLAIRDLPAAIAADNAFIFVLQQALGERLGSALIWVCMGAMWFCGLGSVTSNSRMLFAYARDGGLPKPLAAVSDRFKTPWPAIWCSAACALGVVLWSGGYTVMTALSTIALYASYATPILFGLVARRRAKFPARGPWHLGRWSDAVNLVALGWTAFIAVVFVLPPNQLTGYTFAGALVVLTVGFAARRVRRKS